MQFEEWRELFIDVMGIECLKEETYDPSYDKNMEEDIKKLYDKARDD